SGLTRCLDGLPDNVKPLPVLLAILFSIFKMVDPDDLNDKSEGELPEKSSRRTFLKTGSLVTAGVGSSLLLLEQAQAQEPGNKKRMST
ncbi:MAG: twin-arginine translocation signal domain-containing protein, partial [Nitrososphaerales archaeon]